MEISNPNEVMLQSIEESCSFHSYKKTLETNTNIATDIDYQRNFTSYYRVRRDAAWLKEFYNFFEDNKNNKDITYREILQHLSNLEHSVRVTEKHKDGKAKAVEASFASKMLATINHDHPIWDSQVLRFLNIKVRENLSHANRIDECVRIYDEIEKEITAFIETEAGQECIRLFDKTFPNCKDFSVYKKIDFYLWNLGK